MNVSLGRELEEYVRQKVGSGDYNTASEVLREGLRLLKERDRLLDARIESMRAEIAVGVKQAKAGELLEGPRELRQLRQRLEDRAARKAQDGSLRSGTRGQGGSGGNP